MTLGSRISQDGLWILRSYWETTLTLSRKTAFTASCHDQIDSGKYDSGRKSALRTSAWQDSMAGVTASLSGPGRDYWESHGGRTCPLLWPRFSRNTICRYQSSSPRHLTVTHLVRRSRADASEPKVAAASASADAEKTSTTA